MNIYILMEEKWQDRLFERTCDQLYTHPIDSYLVFLISRFYLLILTVKCWYYVFQCPTTGYFPSLWARSSLSSQCESCTSPSRRATGGQCSGGSPSSRLLLGLNSGCGSRTLWQSEYGPLLAAEHQGWHTCSVIMDIHFLFENLGEGIKQMTCWSLKIKHWL